MTVKSLIQKHNENNQNSHFFDRQTLKCFGERMSEMRVLKNTEFVTTADGVKHEVYVLSTLQHKHPLGARRSYFYFDAMTYEQVII